jgi:perosamine synthetase
VTNFLIPYGRQSLNEDDRAAVERVLRGDWLTTGPNVPEFEDALALRVDAKFAVAFSSGTAALHGAAFAAGLGAGDLVATSPLTFMASLNCARYVGARPALVDIDAATLNIDLTRVSDKFAALVAVHYAGLPVDLRDLRGRPRIVIEDASHALGASTPDGPVGNCAHSDLTVFSFHPVKPITTGEGGMVTTNSRETAEILRRFRNHGIVPRPESGGWYYQIDDVGYNYRMTDIQAALGVSQLDRLSEFISRRNDIAERYRLLLRELPVGLPPIAPQGFRHGYHLFPIQVDNREVVFTELRERGIGVQVHYVPAHHHPINRDLGVKPGELSNCDAAYSRLISLPIFPELTDRQQDYVISALQTILVS